MEPIAPESPPYEALVAEVARLEQQVADLSEKLAAALAENERLKRSGKRQATPFSKGTRKAQPKKPGRKRGQGNFARRPPPPEEQVTAEIPVPLAETICPGCGGALIADAPETVSITDIPPVLPESILYHLATAHCRDCGRKVRASHPDVAADQRGATAHRLGPRLKARAHWLHYGVGVPVRRVPAILKQFCGLTVTQSALTQDALRRVAGRVGNAYRELRAAIRAEPVVNTDDTGWKINGGTAFLMTFTTPLTTVFQIRYRHRNEEVREVVPGDYGGTLGCDRAASYDAKPLNPVKQQKCLSHIQGTLTEALAGQWGRGRSFALRLRGLLSQAMALWRGYRAGKVPEAVFSEERDRLQAAVTKHLRPRGSRDPTTRRLINELGWHHDRGNLLRFLFEPAVEPTNNRAERALRPAVIARKVSHCSKNDRGAEAFSAFVSVISTERQRGAEDMVEALVAVFATGAVRAPPLAELTTAENVRNTVRAPLAA